MKINARDVESRLASPDPAIGAYLIYGPDRGLVHERADALASAILDDPNDPFALTQLTEEDLKQDPAILADSMVAMSLTGGARLVRVRLSGETGSGPIVEFLSSLEAGTSTAEAILIIESGDLTPRGKLRKTFEPAKRAATVACYADSGVSLAQLAVSMLDAEGLTLSESARNAWIPRLEGDRALARSEIEKLILYKGLKDVRAGSDTVEIEDIEAVAAGQGEATLDTIISQAMIGEIADADDAYNRSLSSGTSPVAVLRALQRRIDQLGAVHAAGGSDTAIARSGAPRFGPPAALFKRQLAVWKGRSLDYARQLAFDAERGVKKSGAPADALVGELVLRLARGARKQRG